MVSRKHPSSSLKHTRTNEKHIVLVPNSEIESINHTNQINGRCHKAPNHQITSPASLAELAYSARAAARATQHLTQLGAPYSECEGSLTVSEDHGQTLDLLLVNSSAHVSCRHYLKTFAQYCVCAFYGNAHATLTSSAAAASAIAIDYILAQSAA